MAPTMWTCPWLSTSRTEHGVRTARERSPSQNNNSEAGGAININAGTFEIGGSGRIKSSGEATGVFANAINNEGVFKHNSTLDQTVSGVIGGTGAVVKDNTGTLTLSGANTYSGGTTVDGSTLKLTGSGRIGNGGLTVNNGGTFSIANDDFNSLGGAITVNEGGTLSTDSTGGGNAHNIGAITLNGGTLSSSGNTWSEGNWILNGDVTVGGSALSTISGLAVGSKSGGGTYNVADSVAGAGTDLLVSAEIKLGSLTKTGTGTMDLPEQEVTQGILPSVKEPSLSPAATPTRAQVLSSSKEAPLRLPMVSISLVAAMTIEPRWCHQPR